MNSVRRIFTLKEASELLPHVQDITAAAFTKAEKLMHQLDALDEDPRRRELEETYNNVVRDWAQQISGLGVDVKGLWLVDFDSGDGIYYCWRYPETSLEYFHHYDSGFDGRRPLGALKVS